MHKAVKYLTLSVLFFTLIPSVLAQAPGAQRSITELGDGLYQVNTVREFYPFLFFW